MSYQQQEQNKESHNVLWFQVTMYDVHVRSGEHLQRLEQTARELADQSERDSSKSETTKIRALQNVNMKLLLGVLEQLVQIE